MSPAKRQFFNDRNTLNQQLNRREFFERAAHTTAATAVSSSLVSMGTPLMAGAEEAGLRRGSHMSSFYNGEIHVNEIGKPEGKPLTTGHTDFKPSWSKTGDRLVCFRRLKDDPNVVNWKTAIFVIDVDGSGFHTLTGANFTEPGHTLYVADFDAQRRTIANLKAFANEARRMVW